MDAYVQVDTVAMGQHIKNLKAILEFLFMFTPFFLVPLAFSLIGAFGMGFGLLRDGEGGGSAFLFGFFNAGLIFAIIFGLSSMEKHITVLQIANGQAIHENLIGKKIYSSKLDKYKRKI